MHFNNEPVICLGDDWRMPLLLILIFAVIEIAVWIGVAQFISGWYVFFWFILAAIIGFKMIAKSLGGVNPRNMQMGAMIFDGSLRNKIPMAIAGFLFFIPGLISDVLAILALLPLTRKVLTQAFTTSMAKRQQKMMNEMFNNTHNPNHPFADMFKQMQEQQYSSKHYDSNIIDGEATEVVPERKQIDYRKK